MNRSVHQYARHLAAQGKALPGSPDVTGYPHSHLQPLDAQRPDLSPPPPDTTAGTPERSNVALRGAGELLRVTKARQAADERLAVTLTLGELKELVRDAALEAVAELGSAPKPALLDRNGIAQALGISVGSIAKLRRDGLPVLMLGDAPRFELEPCLAFLRSRGQS